MQAFKVKGITIHNTHNELSAKENRKNLKESGLLYLTHFLIDENDVIQTWSTKKPSWHTGKGFDKGNMNTISIEICRSTCEEEMYLKAEENAVEFIKALMEKYYLTEKDIYLHRDFDKIKNCPHRLLEIYGNKKNFIEHYFKGVD